MAGKYRTTERNCALCGKPYQARLCKLARGEGRFCSKTCGGRHSLSRVDRQKNKGIPLAADDPRRTKIAVRAVINLAIKENGPVIEAFSQRAVPGTPGECWPWRGAVGADGYGALSVRRVTYRATRLAWQLANDEDLGMRHVLHSCDNPICINPEHLSAGTVSDNMRDMVAKKRGWRQTAEACLRGHAYTEANTYHDIHGGRPRRRCKICMGDEQRRYKARLRGDRAPAVSLPDRIRTVIRR